MIFGTSRTRELQRLDVLKLIITVLLEHLILENFLFESNNRNY